MNNVVKAMKNQAELLRFIPFTSETRSSGVDLPDGTRVRKGAYDAIGSLCAEAGNSFPEPVKTRVEAISSDGGTPLVVAVNEQVKGVIELQDIIKPGIRERFQRLRKMGVKIGRASCRERVGRYV